MKKALKITGWIILTLIGVGILLVLLVRFAFREQASDYLLGMQQRQRVELLREAGHYAAEPQADYRFTYIVDSVRAREIREYFRLDTLTDPAATTWENALALAKFVARNIPHANQQVQPQTRNSTALWEYHLDVEPAFNCRLHGILLHELLLAQGITNRFVTCLPADSLDNDCHVVNVVWLPEQKKWAMIDADQSACVTDPAGEPLSLQEMRERFIAEAPMEVHPLLDDNSDYDFYLPYWAKNLYWFECWEQTGFDREVVFEGRTIALVPEGYGGFAFSRNERTTSDDERFWQAPDTLQE